MSPSARSPQATACRSCRGQRCAAAPPASAPTSAARRRAHGAGVSPPPSPPTPISAQVGELCPPTLSALYKQRLRWAMGWEQVTVRRLEALFSSRAISEPRKWRAFLLLIMR